MTRPSAQSRSLTAALTTALSLCALALLVLPALKAQIPVAANIGATYRIGPKDLLEIRVFEVPDLNGELRVDEDGNINFAPVGELRAQGLTADQLRLRLKEILEERYFQRATVSVQVREFRSSPISVIGAVQQPGDLAFPGRWTLIEALTAAGGLAENHGPVLYVLRRSDNGLSDQIEIPVDALLVHADPNFNIPIFANDLINVPATATYIVYCLGEVESPGAMEFKSNERLTLLAAIARAGGLSDRASSKVTVKRARTDGTDEEIQLDYKDIISGKRQDFKLRDGDVVIVKESFF